MREKITEGTFGSTEVFDQLEGYARGEIQHWMQKLLEEEVTSVLGRIKGGRKASVDRASGYRNGFGKGRRFSMSSGTIDVRRPRVRGLEARFERRVLPLFRRRTKEVGELLPQLYLHGLSQGDFELALRGLLGDGAPLSGSSIERLRGAWQKRSLKGIEPVYLWADGGYVKAGLEQEKAALLVVIAGLRDGRTVVLAVEPGYRESQESWSSRLRSLKSRGIQMPKLGGRTAAVLESQDRQRARPRTEAAAGRSPSAALRDALRRDAARGRGATRQFHRALRQRLSRRGQNSARRLGAHGHLLWLSERALEAPAHDQYCRVTLRGRAPANNGGEAREEGRQRDGADLAGPARGRAIVSQARAPAAPGRSRRGGQVPEWHSSRGEGPHQRSRGRRLMPFTHQLTGPLHCSPSLDVELEAKLI